MDPPQINIEEKQKAHDQSSSQWSLSSLEELKGLDINDMREDQEDGKKQMKQSKKKNEKNIVDYPPLQLVQSVTPIFEVGVVRFKVGEIFIVEATEIENIVDLDNWLFDEERAVVGFVIDVLGRVEKPFYAVKPPKDPVIDAEQILGKRVFYAEGCKTLTESDIKSIKAKNVMEGAIDDSDSSQGDKQELSEQPFVKQAVKPHRKSSFEERPRYRERTRQNKKSRYTNFECPSYMAGQSHQNTHPFPPQPHLNNQAYLNSMYSMYYNSLMQMQAGNSPYYPPGPFQPPPPK